MANEVTLLAVGDVAVNRDDPPSIFAQSLGLLKQADMSFCQLEHVLSEKGCAQVHARKALHAHPRNLSALQSAGFKIVSVAGNHCMDWGVDAFFDSLNNVKGAGILAVGAGKDLQEARKPVIIESRGVKVAFLAYNSILDIGYWAERERPGCAPIRVITIYENIEFEQPGQIGRPLSFAHPDDVRGMVSDIKKAKEQADIVALSLHWGLHFVPYKLAMYQREVGYQAIDAGADIILGTHAHILKGVEVYKGKAIFYSLGNFAFDMTRSPAELVKLEHRLKEIPEFRAYRAIDPEWASTYGFPADSRMSIVVKCLIDKKGIKKVSFIPVLINKQGQPVPQSPNSDGFNQVLKYVQDSTTDQSLGARFNIEGGEVVVSA